MRSVGNNRFSEDFKGNKNSFVEIFVILEVIFGIDP